MAFPLNSKPDWRNPPWLTILLIVVNCIIYLGPQRSEEANWDKAVEFYAHSDLPRLELPRYVGWLRQGGERQRAEQADEVEQALKHGHPGYALHRLQEDKAFLAALYAGRVLLPDEPDYARWREQRIRFDRLKGPAFTSVYASNPGDWHPWTLITAAFLHGSLAHLIGNMVFLFIFGYTVELTLGRARYLAFYLVAGACGEVGDLIARWGSPSLGLGASGAISGLMAMYVMLYGRQRIRFFYQLLFYFDYVTAPAIILLPAWIGHEFLQHWLNEDNVAHMAHAGGLIGGALLLAWHKRRHPETKAPPATAAPAADGFPEAKAKADALVKAMKVAEAREAYARLVKLRPADREVLGRYFNLAKLAPAEEHFHRAAHRLFALEGDDPATAALVHDTFITYWSNAKPRPLLTPDQMARLAVRFARGGKLIDAERLTSLLIRQAPAHQALPTLLLALIHGELKRGGRERAAAHGRTLAERFAGSAEARMAADLLKPA